MLNKNNNSKNKKLPNSEKQFRTIWFEIQNEIEMEMKGGGENDYRK